MASIHAAGEPSEKTKLEAMWNSMPPWVMAAFQAHDVIDPFYADVLGPKMQVPHSTASFDSSHSP